MQKMVKRITSIFSIIIAVLSLMPVFTTRATASNVSDIEQEYPYIYWMPEFQTLALSKQPITVRSIESDNGIIVKSFSDGTEKETHTFDYTFLAIENNVIGDAYRLIYNDITGWEVEHPDTIIKGLTRPTTYYSVFGRESAFEYYSNVSGGLPDEIPPLDDIENQINNALNSTTNVSEQANEVVHQMQSATEQFKKGQITINQFQSIINNNITITNELTDNAGATLADQIAVNNAQNAIQIGQDALIGSQINQNIDQGLNDVENTIRDQMYNDNRLSREMIDELNRLFAPGDVAITMMSPDEILDVIKLIYVDPYLKGEKSKNEVLYEESSGLPGIKGIYGLKANLTYVLNECRTLGDYEYINSLITMIDKSIDGINQAGDVNMDIADTFESSENEEMEYLEMVQNEHSQNITSISPRHEINDSDKQSARNVISIIWDNRFVKSLMVVCGCFMCVCVVLGIKYKV